MTDDQERLEQYLEWRRTADRERAARRRRWLGSTAVVVAIGAVAGGLIAWLAGGAHDAPARVATVRPLENRSPVTAAPDTEPPAVSVPRPPQEQQPVPPQRPTPAMRRRPAASTRPRATPAAPEASQQTASTGDVTPPTMGAPSPEARTESSDVAAAVAPPMPAPVTGPAATAAATPDPPLPVPVPRDEVVTPPAPTEPDPATITSEPKVSDRVAGWLKGEVQEFRDGVKREIGEFRSGYDKLRGAVLKLRGRTPER